MKYDVVVKLAVDNVRGSMGIFDNGTFYGDTVEDVDEGVRQFYTSDTTEVVNVSVTPATSSFKAFYARQYGDTVIEESVVIKGTDKREMIKRFIGTVERKNIVRINGYVELR